MSAASRNSLMRAKLAQHMLQKSQGFTLIELLVVIVIVGILSAVAIPTFLNQIRRARTAEAQTALTDVSRNSEVFRLDQGTYVTSGSYRINPADRGTAPAIFTCGDPEVAGEALKCLEGPDATTFLKLYLTDPFAEKAPNYSTLGSGALATLNTQVIAKVSPDGASGILWEAKANTAIAAAYKNIKNDPLTCRLGLGTGSTIGLADGGPNIDGGCNLKDTGTTALGVPVDR